MRLRVFKVFIAIALAGGVLAVPAAGAQTKNYFFPEVKIEIRIAADGSFTVEEERTFEFRGRFSWASMWLPTRYDRGSLSYRVAIEDFSVLDASGGALRTEVSTPGDRFEAKWFYSASNEKRTFRLRYRVRGAVFSYPDITEIYWQAIGGGWEKPTRNASITVHLPAPVASKDDLLVYGHGPLSGVATILDTQTARFTATNVKAGQFLEIRMAWPSGLIAGVPSTLYGRESLRQEEARFIQETVVRLEKESEADARRARTMKTLTGLWLGAMILIPLLWLPFFLRTWRRVGQDYHFPGLPEYFREPASKLPPAIVELLMKEGVGITPKSFTATIFDLARRGRLEIRDQLAEKRHFFHITQEYDTTIILKKAYRRDPDLRDFEIDVLDLLFEGMSGGAADIGASLAVEDLKKYLKRNPQKFRKWYEAWSKSVKEEGKKLGFIEPESLRARNQFALVTVPLIIFTLNPLLAVLGASLIPTLKRRTLTWAREYEQWKAFRRFLGDFSNFKDIPPEAYKLWEYYLVFGILFGYAAKILKTLPVVLQSDQAAVPVWYANFGHPGFLSSGGLDHMISSINTMSASIQSAASYSSGSGGGFSGGGGGGAGGGGGGAG